jgi:hypothetical protein
MRLATRLAGLGGSSLQQQGAAGCSGWWPAWRCPERPHAACCRFAVSAQTEVDQMYAGSNATVTESLSSIRVIHAYNLQEHVCGTYSQAIGRVSKQITRMSNVAGIANGYSNLIMFGMYSLIIWFGAQEIKCAPLPPPPDAAAGAALQCKAEQSKRLARCAAMSVQRTAEQHAQQPDDPVARTAATYPPSPPFPPSLSPAHPCWCTQVRPLRL